MMHTVFALALLFGSTALSADVTFDSAEDCTGQPLYGSNDMKDVPCFDISDFDEARSAVVANLALDETVAFFSDGRCHEPIGSVAHRTCYVPKGRMGSFAVRSSKAMTRDIDTSNVAMTDYSALAISSPETIDSIKSNLVVAAALTAVAGGLQFYLAWDTCYTAVKHKDVKGIFNCVATPLAVGASSLATTVIERTTPQIRQRLAQVDGSITNIPVKRDLIDQFNFEHMAQMMNASGGNHVGHMVRRMGSHDQTSPIYEIEAGDGQRLHLSAFLNEAEGDFTYHMHSAEATANELRKRHAPYSYNSIRWNTGGFDFRLCPHNTNAPASGYKGVSKQKRYDIIFDQIRCQTTADKLRHATNMRLDFHNERLTRVGAVYIKAFHKRGVVPPPCGGGTVPLNGDCFGP